MNENKTLAARFFFRNCAVSIYQPGEMQISYNLKPDIGDVVFDRDFIPASSHSEFLGEQSDFYRFLDGTSTTSLSLVKKLLTIGYLLCNKLPKHMPMRFRSFICVNEDKTAICNGKSLFCRAVAHYCNTIQIEGRAFRSHLGLSNVTNQTQLLIVEGVSNRFDIQQIYPLCSDDWIINRKGLKPLIIPFKSSPHMLLVSNIAIANLRSDGGFRRRFRTLEFSSFFSESNTVRDFLGHNMFTDWNISQWHAFDNLMLDCVLEYLQGCSRGEDIFSLYS